MKNSMKRTRSGLSDGTTTARSKQGSPVPAFNRVESTLSAGTLLELRRIMDEPQATDSTGTHPQMLHKRTRSGLSGNSTGAGSGDNISIGALPHSTRPSQLAALL